MPRVSKEAHMAGTKGVMGRTVGEEFRVVMAGKVCMRKTEVGKHLIQCLISHKAMVGTLAFTLSETGNHCRIIWGCRASSLAGNRT